MSEGRSEPVAPSALSSADVLRAFDGYQNAQREAAGLDGSCSPMISTV